MFMSCYLLFSTALPLLWAGMSIWRGSVLGLVSPLRGSCDAPCGSFLPLPFRRSGWIPLGASTPRSLRLTRDVDYDVTAPTFGASSAWLPLGGGFWRQTLSRHSAQVRTPLPSSRRLTHVALAACVYIGVPQSELAAYTASLPLGSLHTSWFHLASCACYAASGKPFHIHAYTSLSCFLFCCTLHLVSCTSFLHNFYISPTYLFTHTQNFHYWFLLSDSLFILQPSRHYLWALSIYGYFWTYYLYYSSTLFVLN